MRKLIVFVGIMFLMVGSAYASTASDVDIITATNGTVCYINQTPSKTAVSLPIIGSTDNVVFTLDWGYSEPAGFPASSLTSNISGFTVAGIDCDVVCVGAAALAGDDAWTPVAPYLAMDGMDMDLYTYAVGPDLGTWGDYAGEYNVTYTRIPGPSGAFALPHDVTLTVN